jgi:acetyl-CoA carboxylase biotin carboxyl carrier protein
MAHERSSRRQKPSKLGFELKEIEELIDLLIDREISEIEIEKAGTKIRILRGGARASAPAGYVPPPVLLPPAPMPPGNDPTATHALAEPSSADSTEGLYLIKSPIVGTFYGSPAPNAPAFVKLGDVVHVGQVLCIIEAMKLMNEIESEAAGEIVRIYVENGQPVEYGQSLFAINPSHKK